MSLIAASIEPSPASAIASLVRDSNVSAGASTTASSFACPIISRRSVLPLVAAAELSTSA
ncbi:hypothetical protein [Burkholderia vietnamiensis]|uniref:hypothetical protein n=1 Tax=Burkholderia vietnamiensis TaxID=60552 RepID=UPI001CF211F0|nr:hypothetical protein [Burkholderia vietnamiensis]MCA8269287.1 hypothetical protein [Burkholderia vietnamiensis]